MKTSVCITTIKLEEQVSYGRWSAHFMHSINVVLAVTPPSVINLNVNDDDSCLVPQGHLELTAPNTKLFNDRDVNVNTTLF